MTSHLANPELDLDLAEYDLWAIRCVVREGKWMNLTREEQIIAAQLMQLKGMDNRAIAERLRICVDSAQRYTNRKCPIDLSKIPANVMGAPIIDIRITRADVGRR